MALYVAPLCPAGHLPHRWGDQAFINLCISFQRRKENAGSDASNLPTCGGDVRQDRGGQRRELRFPAMRHLGKDR